MLDKPLGLCLSIKLYIGWLCIEVMAVEQEQEGDARCHTQPHSKLDVLPATDTHDASFYATHCILWMVHSIHWGFPADLFDMRYHIVIISGNDMGCFQKSNT